MALVVKTRCVTPSEFWKMSPSEGALFIDELMQSQPQSGLDAETIARLEKKAAKLRYQGHNIL